MEGVVNWVMNETDPIVNYTVFDTIINCCNRHLTWINPYFTYNGFIIQILCTILYTIIYVYG